MLQSARLPVVAILVPFHDKHLEHKDNAYENGIPTADSPDSEDPLAV
jgi:hypothetical protein